MEISLSVSKNKVYDEVAKTTSYVGAKAADDGSLYERIFTTDEDRLMLERFWNEACNTANQVFMPFLDAVSGQGDASALDMAKNYVVTVSLGECFDEKQKAGMESSLFSFFVSYITGKWFRMTSPNDAEMCANDAVAALDDVKRKLYHKKKPTRKAV